MLNQVATADQAPAFVVVVEDHPPIMPAAVLEAVEAITTQRAATEQPAKRPPPRITRENARMLALKSHEARRNAKAAAEAERIAALNPPATDIERGAIKPAPWSEELEIVQRQITRTTLQLEDDMEPNERAQLVRALDLMLDRKRILQERPLPGSRRPAPETSRPRAASLLGSVRSDHQAPGTPQEQE